MTCDERKDLILLYACDQLDPADRESLRAHLLTGCPACIGAFAEAEAMVARLALAVPPVAPPTSAFDRVLATIRHAAAPPVHSWTRRLAVPAFAAAVAVALTCGVWLYFTRDALQFWRSSNLVTVVLTSKTQPAARGQVWWDHDSRQWRVSVTNLSETTPGREYELWLIPAGGKPIRSKTFNVAPRGKLTIVVPVPADISSTTIAAITDEPLGGSDSPTGQIHLAGTFE